jgi:hypothetical protein
VEGREEDKNFILLSTNKVMNFTAHVFSQNKVKTLKVLAPKVGYEDVVWAVIN